MRFTITAAALVAIALGLASAGGCSDDAGKGGGASSTSGTTSAPATSSTSASQGGGGGSGGEGQGAGPNCDPPVGGLPALQLVPTVTGVDQPVYVVSPPDGSGRLFVAERPGAIRIFADGQLLAEPFLDLTSLVSCCDDDKGFQGLAFHPDFAQNGLFYVHYTLVGTPFDSTTILAEYRVSTADPNVADPTPLRTLFTLPQPDVWHYGGSIAFGPDGMLYYSRGDGGSGGDPGDDAQNPMSQLGKILRIDVATFPAPPPGNMPGADPFVWDMGLRNVWRMSFDACTGDLYLGDVGQGDWEEVSVHPWGEAHKNFGWARYEGSSCFSTPCDPVGKTFPVVEFEHQATQCAVIGGYVYRGHAIPGLRGRYLYADICTKRVWSFVFANGMATDPVELTADLQSDILIGDYSLSSFGEDADHELYITDMSGTVYRIEAE